MEIPGGWGGGVPTGPLERKFPGGRGVQNKKPSVGGGGGVWIFSGTTQSIFFLLPFFLDNGAIMTPRGCSIFLHIFIGLLCYFFFFFRKPLPVLA